MKFSVATLASLIAVVQGMPHRRQAGGALSTTDITTNATANNPDIQSSLTLDSSVIATGFAQNGQAVQEAGQVASLTSNNNFINFCATTNQPITNGQQIKTGSCNPAPMGQIPAVTAMPSAKFVNPPNFGSIPADQDFNIVMNVLNFETGNFVNAQNSYFAAPQQLNTAGQIVGHSHVVVEAINGLNDTTPTNPQVFAFFLGLNAAATGGQLTATVKAGLPAGTYRLASINTAANHQPALVPVAQHGSLDDMVYFTVAGGAQANNATAEAAAADQGSVGNAVAAAGAAAASAAAAVSGSAAGAAASEAVQSASLAAIAAGLGGGAAAAAATTDAASVTAAAAAAAATTAVSAAGSATGQNAGGFGSTTGQNNAGGFGSTTGQNGFGKGGFGKGKFGGKGGKRRFAREY
jgi:hypothetical protein